MCYTACRQTFAPLQTWQTGWLWHQGDVVSHEGCA